MPESVVVSSLVLVAENFVRLVDFFKFFPGLRVVVMVGMTLESELAEGLLYLLSACIPGHPEYFIVIFFSSHIVLETTV